ncbi:hypothetical protein DWB85_18495 [Seongchinamella sediminis]|uniref:DNA-directed DNA polymerase n=2 Tax=Seongchinamella sediminis TaxID=2283635 RepID=A0A3L7DUU1_9GAMM|nr:hypothetical protein DWB85_18495 [Seongchinamella sediminis]
MAYSVTYWHCADTSCSEYARSVKLSHCQGSNCDKIIDSREDKHACNPWEVRSYKKMYFCSKCGSCCPSHANAKGYSTCPGCGRADGYTSPPDGSGRMTCIHCDHRIVVPWDRRESVRQGYVDQPDSRGEYDNAPGISTQFVLPIQFLTPGTGGCMRLSRDTSGPVLYVYDLFACLKNGFVKNLAGYQKIYDVMALEKLHYLGKFHPRYGHGESDSYGLLKHLANVSSQEMLEGLDSRVWKYLANLLQATEASGVLRHYEKLELPFTLALFSLVGAGIDVDRGSLLDMTSNIELERNKLVEPLREQGIDTPTRDSLREWLPYSDSPIDSSFVMDRIDHIDFKSVRHLDQVFDAFYRIEKLERMGACIKGISEYTGNFVPDYQVIGTNTLRCTSKKPNLLGFPKQLRPIVRAANGKCIVECDYAQMEVGISGALAEDELLISDYNSGDVYSALGAELGIDRDSAKLVFLAILYGVGERTVQVWLQKPRDNVRQFLQELFARYSHLESYQEELVNQGRSLGYVESISGVRRSVRTKDRSGTVDQESTRAWETNWFKNYPVQASAATVFKQAVIEVGENVEPREFKLIAPLYDAIVFEVPLQKKDFYTDLVVSAMKRAMVGYFPVLNPQISVNDHDVSCWNGGEGVAGINDFLSEGVLV